jgi:hypothetical protein
MGPLVRVTMQPRASRTTLPTLTLLCLLVLSISVSVEAGMPWAYGRTLGAVDSWICIVPQTPEVAVALEAYMANNVVHGAVVGGIDPVTKKISTHPGSARQVSDTFESAQQ